MQESCMCLSWQEPKKIVKFHSVISWQQANRFSWPGDLLHQFILKERYAKNDFHCLWSAEVSQVLSNDTSNFFDGWP